MGSRLEKNSAEVRKRIQSHTFEDEQGEEYEASKFGGFSDYMRRKKLKLQNLDAEIRSHSTDKTPIFRGIVAHVNGFTQPSLSDLHNMIVSHGGGFLQYLDGKTAVTHIIASHLTPKKRVEFARYRIVKPAWIVDSIKMGNLLTWDSYRLVDEGATQRVLNFDGGAFTSQMNIQKQQSYREHSSERQHLHKTHDRSQDQIVSPGESQTLRQVSEDNELGAVASAMELMVTDEDDPSVQDPNLELKVQNKLSGSPKDAIYITDDVHIPFDDMAEETDPLLSNTVDISRGSVDTSESLIQNSLQSSERGKSPQKRQLTAEEHNVILLSNPHLAKSSTANPDFINQYYRESRLHHLSTWKADLKAQLQARAQEKSSSQNTNQKKPGARRYILHVDFDSFFAAVSLRKHPQLVDKPTVIAHGSGPGSEIASCNYPARKFGVKNGMWMRTAFGLCKELNVLPYDFKAYEEASRHFYDSILSVDGIVQSISIDEALADISDQCVKNGGTDGRAISEGSIFREQERAQQVAQAIRESVKEKTGCEVSVGIGNNILLAKAALRKAKPAGQHLVKPEEVLDFLGELTVTDLPGVAWSIGNKLEEIGVKFVKDIRNLTKEKLITTLGPKTGEKIWDYSRGIDKQEVGEQVVRKSVSAEINWGIRFINQQQAEEFVQCLSDELSKRLLDQLVKGRQLTMKILRKAADAGMDPPKNLGHGKCDTFSKSFVFGVATNDKTTIGREAVSMLRSYGFPPGELRGLGVQMQKLEPLKPVLNSVSNLQDSSQRRLQFKKPDGAPKVTRSEVPDQGRDRPPKHGREQSIRNDFVEGIEEVVSPQELKTETTISGALETITADAKIESFAKPLNIGGTQFVLPTQVDSAVLQELPTEIRQRLATQQKSVHKTYIHLDSLNDTRSLSVSPYPSDSEVALPNQSQLDPDILAALPEEVRQELMAQYRNLGAGNSRPTLQKGFPQSPTKPKASAGSKKQSLTPTKKVKTVSVLGRARPKATDPGASSLTQSNFVSASKVCPEPADVQSHPTEEISQSFLEELPEDIRLEILAEQKRNRIKSKSGLDIGTLKRKPRNAHNTDFDGECGQQRIYLPKQPSRPTFTSKRLSTLPELRDAMSSWVQEFSTADEDGPFPEDVEALGQYLKRVVLDECDMSKAVAVIDWIVYVVESQKSMDTSVRAAWNKAITNIRDIIQLAVKKRGLPPVNFGSIVP